MGRLVSTCLCRSSTLSTCCGGGGVAAWTGMGGRGVRAEARVAPHRAAAHQEQRPQLRMPRERAAHRGAVVYPVALGAQIDTHAAPSLDERDDRHTRVREVEQPPACAQAADVRHQRCEGARVRAGRAAPRWRLGDRGGKLIVQHLEQALARLPLSRPLLRVVVVGDCSGAAVLLEAGCARVEDLCRIRVVFLKESFDLRAPETIKALFQ